MYCKFDCKMWHALHLIPQCDSQWQKDDASENVHMSLSLACFFPPKIVLSSNLQPLLKIIYVHLLQNYTSTSAIAQTTVPSSVTPFQTQQREMNGVQRIINCSNQGTIVHVT